MRLIGIGLKALPNWNPHRSIDWLRARVTLSRWPTRSLGSLFNNYKIISLHFCHLTQNSFVFVLIFTKIFSQSHHRRNFIAVKRLGQLHWLWTSLWSGPQVFIGRTNFIEISVFSSILRIAIFCFSNLVLCEMIVLSKNNRLWAEFLSFLLKEDFQRR